jgi:uncharacterized membrane protein
MAGDNEDRIAAALEGLARQIGELQERMSQLEARVLKGESPKAPEVAPIEVVSKPPVSVTPVEIAVPHLEVPKEVAKPETAAAQASAHVNPLPPLSVEEEIATRQAQAAAQAKAEMQIPAPAVEKPKQMHPVQPIRPVSSRAADFVARQQEVAAASYVADASATNYQQRPEPEPAKERLEYSPPAEYRKPPEPKNQRTLEQALGKNWAAWIGGVVVVLGMLFFLKYAWDQGWVQLTPAMRIGAGVLVGMIFCAVGEWMHFKKIPVLAATMHGVGLATVMGSMFAANALFKEPVLSTNAAFIGVVITGIVGIALSMHIRQMTLTIIALVGMYIAPAILSTGKDSSLPFMCFLCVIGLLGVAVSILKQRWIAVRWVTWAGTWIWTLAWTLAPQIKVQDHVTLGLVAPSIFLLMFLIETVVRVRGARKEERRTDFAAPDGQGALSLFLDTGAALAVEWIFFSRAQLPNLFVLPLVLAVLNLLMYFATPAKLVRVMGMMLACGLTTLAAPLYFSLESITLAWAVMSLVVAVYAMTTGHVAARIWSVALYFLVVARVVGFDSMNDRLNSTLGMLGRAEVTWWSIMAWGTAVFGVVLARMQSAALAKSLRSQDKSPRSWALADALEGAPRVTSAVAVLVFCVVAVRLMLKGPEITLGHAFILAAFGCLARDIFARWAATAVLVIASAFILGEQWRHADMQLPVVMLGKFPVTRWLILAWSAGLLAIGFGGMARMLSAIGKVPENAIGNEYRIWQRVAGAIGVAVLAAIGLRLMEMCPEATLAHALALAALGCLSRDVIARWAGTGLLALTAFYILGALWRRPDMQEQLLVIGNFVITRWIFLAWGSSFLALIFATLARLRTRGMENGLKETNAYAATAIFLIASAMHFVSLERFDPFSAVTLAGACWTIGMLVLSMLFKDAVYKNQVMVLTLICLAKWALLDGLLGSAAYKGAPVTPVIHLFSLSGVLIAAAVIFVQLPTTITRDNAISIKSWVVGSMGFLWLNLEALRVVDFMLKGASSMLGTPWIVKNVTLSVLWATVGFTCIVWGFAKRHASVRWAGLILLGITVTKVLLIDMANVKTVLRILSFVVTGLLLLGVSFIYHKASSKSNSQADAPENL